MLTPPLIPAFATRLALTAVMTLSLLACSSLPAVAFPTPVEEEATVNIYENAAKAVITISTVDDEEVSSGAGVIIDPDGTILTARHVVGDYTTVFVALADGTEVPGRVLAVAEGELDLAVVKIKADKPLPFVTLGDTSSIKVGQSVLAIGNPYGFERTLTLGIVSRIDTERKLIQTDAAINPGNSGGPLINRQGQVIAINKSIFNPSGRAFNVGIGFAIPVDQAKPLLDASKTATDKVLVTIEAPELPSLLHLEPSALVIH